MSILRIPPELVLLIAENLEQPRDVYALLRTDRAFVYLKSVLLKFATTWPHVDAALYWAAASGNEALVQLVMDKGPRIFVCVDRHCGEPCKFHKRIANIPHSLAGQGSGFVAAVLEQGPNLVAGRYNSFQTSALNWAIRNWHEPLLKLLLREGADVGASDCHGDTPLHVAAAQGGELAARLLLQHGADSNAGDRGSVIAAYRVPYRLDSLAALLFENVSLEDNHEELAHAVHFAARQYGPKSVELLLKKGADVNCLQEGRTPLHTAIRAWNYAAARSLLENGADAEAKDKRKATSLQMLLTSNPNSQTSAEMAKLLVEKGADVRSKDRSGVPMIHRAVCGRTFGLAAGDSLSRLLLGRAVDEDLTRSLLESGADPSAQDSYTRTPLHLVIQFVHKNRQASFTRTILDHGVDLDRKDQYGRTILHIAVKHQMSRAAIRMLLEAGANVNLHDAQGRSPLHLAAKHSKAVVGMLLDYGADVTGRDAFGRPSVSIELRKYFSMAPYCSFVDADPEVADL